MAGLAAAQLPKEAEPTYAGKRLSDWMALIGSTDAAERSHAMAALRLLGGDPDALAENLLAGALEPKLLAAHVVALDELGPAAVPALARGRGSASSPSGWTLMAAQLSRHSYACSPIRTMSSGARVTMSSALSLATTAAEAIRAIDGEGKK